MSTLCSLLLFCAVAPPPIAGPTYTVYLRDLTAPERCFSQQLNDSVCVIDAVATLQKVHGPVTQMDMWILRPDSNGKVRVLPIDWKAITQQGVTTSNYQILDGDRLFLQARPGR